jgi:hypothetical protein
VIEQAIADYDDNSQHFDVTLINISGSIPVAMKWLVKCGKPRSGLAHRRWTTTLAAKTDEALSVADYSAQGSTLASCAHAASVPTGLAGPRNAILKIDGCSTEWLRSRQSVWRASRV